MSNEQNNGGPSDDEIRRLVNLPFNQDENGTEWVTLTPQMLARAVRRALATTAPAVNQQLTTEPVDEREAFEKWVTENGAWPQALRREPGATSYYLASTAAKWEAWQARSAVAKGVKG